MRDINGNGAADGIGELFGNTLTDGFTALRALDSNGDNRINASDANFAQLRVWSDLNGDGISQAGEVVSLASLSLERNANNTLNAGNAIPIR